MTDGWLHNTSALTEQPTCFWLQLQPTAQQYLNNTLFFYKSKKVTLVSTSI